MYSEPRQTPNKELCDNAFQPLFIFAKKLHLRHLPGFVICFRWMIHLVRYLLCRFAENVQLFPTACSFTEKSSATEIFIKVFLHCLKGVCIQSYSGPHFPAFQHLDWIRRDMYSVRMWENADQNNSEYGHFSRSTNKNNLTLKPLTRLRILKLKKIDFHKTRKNTRIIIRWLEKQAHI